MPIVKNSIRVLACLLAAAALSGCYTRTITKIEYVPVLITDVLLEPIPPTAPPSKAEYLGLASDPEIDRLKNRVKMLRNLNTSLYGDIGMCNRRLIGIGELNISITDKVKELNKKEVK